MLGNPALSRFSKSTGLSFDDLEARRKVRTNLHLQVFGEISLPKNWNVYSLQAKTLAHSVRVFLHFKAFVKIIEVYRCSLRRCDAHMGLLLSPQWGIHPIVIFSIRVLTHRLFGQGNCLIDEFTVCGSGLDGKYFFNKHLTEL